MHLTKKASYGLVAVFELAGNMTAGPLSAGAIAEKYALPVPFVEKILHQLGRSHLVESRQGRGGGYTLACDPEAVSVRCILEALGESLDLVDCLASGETCRLAGICPTRPAWRKIDQRFKDLLGSLSLRDLLAE
ncbi:Rrf2 family transcriptional regulator [Candidatus Bipolaricaulota bacterium]|nr:Rrf2 family transcriptional regulator [Candidatus Bipolaricaulota bacterium]